MTPQGDRELTHSSMTLKLSLGLVCGHIYTDTLRNGGRKEKERQWYRMTRISTDADEDGGMEEVDVRGEGLSLRLC